MINFVHRGIDVFVLKENLKFIEESKTKTCYEPNRELGKCVETLSKSSGYKGE